MSVLDDEEILIKKTDDDLKFIAAQEKVMLRYVIPGFVRCVVASSETNSMLKKFHELYGVPHYESSFADRLRKTLEKSMFSLVPHKGRRVLSIDCRDLKKGDALGWIGGISKGDNDAIVVIENVTRIPEGDSALYDPKQYVEDILARSWKNDEISVGDYHIDRRNLTVILTCPPEDEEQLRAVCSMCSYAWVGDIEKKIESKLAEL